jgi:hypothetical protein
MRLKYKLAAVITLLFLGLLFQGGCELFRKYEIEGMWTLVKTVNGVETILEAEFVKYTRDSGFVFAPPNSQGSYTFEYDTEVNFFLAHFEPGAIETGRMDTFTGGFDDHDTMSGTVEVVDADAGIQEFGEWQAVKREAEF